MRAYLLNMASSLSYASSSKLAESRLELPIVRAGLLFEYTIPSFPAITVSLRHVVYQLPCKDGSCKVFDGFMKQCPLLDVNLPALAEIEEDETKAWFINVRNSLFNTKIC